MEEKPTAACDEADREVLMERSPMPRWMLIAVVCETV